MLLPQKVVAVACERWLFTRGSYYRDLTGKHLVFLDRWLLIRVGRLQEVVAHGGSTV